MVIVHKIQNCECKECGEDQDASVTIIIVWYILHVKWLDKYIKLPILNDSKMGTIHLQTGPKIGFNSFTVLLTVKDLSYC